MTKKNVKEVAMPLLPFAPFEPDQPAYQAGGVSIRNVCPGRIGYRPFPAFGALGSPLPGGPSQRAQGACFTRGADGSGKLFAGTGSGLYLRQNAGGWTDVSGAAYACPPEGRWQFTQFGKLVIAVNGVNPAQKFDLESSIDFAPLAGSPPVAACIATVRDFVFMGRLAGALDTVHWSGIDKPEIWTPSLASLCDLQVLPDGGFVQAVVGGEYAVVLQERAIRLFTFVGGDTIFQVDKIAEDVGASIEGSVAAWGNRVFFVHRSGFYMLMGGALTPIGSERVNGFFWSDLNEEQLHRVSAAIDPVRKLYVISYVGSDAAAPDRLLLYNWDLDAWAPVHPGAHELIWSAHTQAGYDLDALDGESSNLDGLTFGLDSVVWAGAARPLLGAFDGEHKLAFADPSNPTLAATLDTVEGNPAGGQRALVTAFRPLLQGSSVAASAALLSRSRLDEAASLGPTLARDPASGMFFPRANARYHRFRVMTAPGDLWTQALGVDDIAAAPAGWR